MNELYGNFRVCVQFELEEKAFLQTSGLIATTKKRKRNKCDQYRGTAIVIAGGRGTKYVYRYNPLKYLLISSSIVSELTASMA